MWGALFSISRFSCSASDSRGVNAIDSNDPSNAQSCRDGQDKSPRIWAFLIGVYWVSFVTYYCLWKSYKKVFLLRNALHSSEVARPQQYTVLVRDIPAAEKHETRTEQVDAFFRRTHPAAYERCMVMRHLDKVTRFCYHVVCELCFYCLEKL